MYVININLLPKTSYGLSGNYLKILTQQKTLEAKFSSNWPMMILTSLSCKHSKQILETIFKDY